MHRISPGALDEACGTFPALLWRPSRPDLREGCIYPRSRVYGPLRRGCFTTALGNFVAAPFLLDRIPLNEIVTLIQECRIIDRINQRYMMPIAPKGEMRERETETLREVIDGSIARASLTRGHVVAALGTFRLLSTGQT